MGSLKVLYLEQLDTAIGSLTGSFTEHPQVADGASAVFNDVFGQGHTRLVFGVASLPAGMCVELEVIARLAG